MKNNTGTESATSGLSGFDASMNFDILVASVKASGVPVMVSMQRKHRK